jgi:hypothetical protein
MIGERLEFASITNDRAGWSQIAQRTESAVRSLVNQ